jgi:hypothetical protein
LQIIASFGTTGGEDEQNFEDFFHLENEAGDMLLELEELDGSFDRERMSILKIEVLIPKLEKLKLEGENYPFAVINVEADIELVMENGPAVFPIAPARCTWKARMVLSRFTISREISRL